MSVLAWARDVEPPAGEKDMGGWKSVVYTAEQQARLGVDEQGNLRRLTASEGWLDAAAAGDVSTIRVLAQAGEDLNATDEDVPPTKQAISGELTAGRLATAAELS